ncbi:hypothetical protein QYE76_022451 [Lolium multiflorum]|uniref:Transposase (putative) gypsy type domain-containing protein n=1 Tax=Lolium multiflorum TaxID=4521 RepID=A0AAD8RCM7_LOLMU|nr:hypothetical protein QYE76_022451 [Lolium multiflorum]
MPPHTKLLKHKAPGTDTPMEKAQVSGWERSKISAQDQKMLKKACKKQDSLKFPGDESFPRPPIRFRVRFMDHLICGLSTPMHEFLCGLLFIYGIQLQLLTPNSILHISIFITLCECFLGIHPHWGLWKCIFYLRRNNYRNNVYNVGGVCIYVRPDIDYFDVKFPNVQGWRKRWLYIQDEYIPSQEYGITPFEAAKEIQRRRSWDTEATAEEKAAIEALMHRIHQLQTLIERNSQNHQILSSLPPLPQGGEVDGCVVVTDDSQETSLLESEAVESQKSKASSEKETGSEQSDSGHSATPPLATSPGRKRKRSDVEDSGASKPTESTGEETSSEDEGTFDPFDDAGTVSSPEGKSEEGEPTAHGAAPTSTSNTLVISEEHRIAAETSTPPRQNMETCTPIPNPQAPFPKKAKVRAGNTLEIVTGSSSTALMDDPLMRDLINVGTQFTRFRDEAETLREALRRAEECADALEAKLKSSEAAREKAEKEAAAVEDSSKIGVEGTIAFVAASGQDVNWVKAGSPKGLNKEKWKALVRDAKPHSKKNVAYLNPKSTASASTTGTKIK